MNTILLSCLFSPDELPFMKEGRIAASKKIIVTVKLPWPVAGTDLDLVLCNVLDKFRGKSGFDSNYYMHTTRHAYHHHHQQGACKHTHAPQFPRRFRHGTKNTCFEVWILALCTALCFIEVRLFSDACPEKGENTFWPVVCA